MTKSEMTKWLLDRYQEQCEKYPRTREINEKQYISANLSHMVRSPYWRNRPIDGYPKDPRP
jgi:hypothetical protein